MTAAMHAALLYAATTLAVMLIALWRSRPDV